MSTYYATFDSLQSGKAAVDELLRDGILPEDISLVGDYHGNAVSHELVASKATVGDASYFVGRSDDPVIGRASIQQLQSSKTPRTEMDLMDGIDTSHLSSDVESLDQADDSQAMAEEVLDPEDGRSQEERERGDLRSELNTGFKEEPSESESLYDTQTLMQDQNTKGLETISVPGRGVVIGSGGLSTAALDLLSLSDGQSWETFSNFLIEEGLTEAEAASYRDAICAGQTMIAVEIVPGRVSETLVETVIERRGGAKAQLFDAPRFHEKAYRIRMEGWGNS